MYWWARTSSVRSEEWQHSSSALSLFRCPQDRSVFNVYTSSSLGITVHAYTFEAHDLRGYFQEDGITSETYLKQDDILDTHCCQLFLSHMGHYLHSFMYLKKLHQCMTVVLTADKATWLMDVEMEQVTPGQLMIWLWCMDTFSFGDCSHVMLTYWLFSSRMCK